MPAAQRTGGPRVATTPATSGSQTITASSSGEQGAASRHIHIPPSGTLRLRAEPSSTAPEPEAERRVQWAEGVVNNEGMGKKSSKVCCIYHKPRPIDESSDEDSSNSSSEDDSDNDDGAAKPSGKGKGKKPSHDHGDRQHDNGCQHHAGKGKQSKRTPNAYEHIPKNG